MGSNRVDSSLDLTGVLCPINWVRTKLALEEMAPGQVLAIDIDDGEPMRNVPRSAKAEGHTVVGVEPLPSGSYRLLIRRGEE